MIAVTCRLIACLGVTAGCLLPVATPAGASTVTTRALRTYEPVGKAVDGTSSAAGAPALTPGQFKDSLRAGEQKNYTITLADGVTPYLSVTVIRPLGVVPEAGQDYASFSDDVKIAIGTSDGDDCGYDDASTSQDRSVGPALATARPGRVGTGWTGGFAGSSDSRCGKPGKYVVTVSRTQSAEQISNVDLPMEIIFVAEPPLSNDVTTLPAGRPISTSSLAPDITAEAAPVSGGGSYNTAAVLDRSGGYSDGIRPGETLYYRMRLGQGQRAGYTVRFHGQQALDEILSVGTSLSTPYRGEVVDSEDSGSYSSTSDETLSAAMAAPVAYRNRESDSDSVENLRLSGYYYLAVSMANSRAPTSTEVPINVAVKIEGKAMDQPKYRQVAGASDPGDLGLPGQAPPGASLIKAAYLGGGALALALALLVLFVPMLRRRRA